MSDTMIENIKNNLSILGMRNSFENIDTYLENAIKNKIPIQEFLNLILEREAQTKKNRAVENQIKKLDFQVEKPLNFSILTSNQI